MKFKIGDEVRVKSCVGFPERIGWTGTIIKIDNSYTDEYIVKYTDKPKPTLWYDAHELELIDLDIFKNLGD